MFYDRLDIFALFLIEMSINGNYDAGDMDMDNFMKKIGSRYCFDCKLRI